MKILADFKRKSRRNWVLLKGILGVIFDDLKSLSVTSTRKQLFKKLIDGLPATIG